MLRQRIINELSALLAPQQCLICQRPGTELCDRCDRFIVRFKSARYLSLMNSGARDTFAVWPAATISPELTKIILIAKEKNIQSARNYLAHLLVESYMRAENTQRNVARISLIPIPSSTRANRQRGYKHSLELAKAVRRELLHHVKSEVVVCDLLRVNRSVADQSGLDRAARIANLRGAYSVTESRSALPQGRADVQSAYLIDDLMTTGTSLQEGHRALTEAGIWTEGALVAGASAT